MIATEWPLASELDGELGAEAPAAHDDHVHSRI